MTLSQGGANKNERETKTMHNRDQQNAAPMNVESTKKRSAKHLGEASAQPTQKKSRFWYYETEIIPVKAPKEKKSKAKKEEEKEVVSKPRAKESNRSKTQVRTSSRAKKSALSDTDYVYGESKKHSKTLYEKITLPKPARKKSIDSSDMDGTAKPQAHEPMSEEKDAPLTIAMPAEQEEQQEIKTPAKSSKKQDNPRWEIIEEENKIPKKESTKAKRKGPTFTEARFATAIGKHADSTSAQRLENIIGYQVKNGYKFFLDCANLKDDKNPFDLLVTINPFSEFHSPAKHADVSRTSWIFANGSARFNTVLPDYKFIPPTNGESPFYEFHVWEQSTTHDNAKLAQRGREVLRGWITWDGTLGEIHTVNKGYHELSNPIPGKKVISIFKTAMMSFFHHRKPMLQTYADSSYKKPDLKIKGKLIYHRIPLRLCNVLATGKTYYQEDFPNAEPIYNPTKYSEAVARVRSFTLNDFYQILDTKQRESFIKIYNATLGKAKPVLGSEAKFSDAENPFTKSAFTLAQLQVAVLKTSKTASHDYELNELICDGILIRDEEASSYYTKHFKPGTKLHQFKEDIHTMLWECGYYWKFKVGEEKAEVAKTMKKR